MNDADRALLADVEATHDAAERFFARFSDVEWARAHGADWIFADVPYHLAIYNRMIANVLLLGAESDNEESPALINLQQLDTWNQASLRAMRWAGNSSDGLTKFRDSFAMLRAAIAMIEEAPTGFDTPIWMMNLRARGWRTARVALEYVQWHTWLHLSEAGVRYDNKHPFIAPSALRRALDFELEWRAGAVDAARAAAAFREKPVQWAWELKLPETGVAAWTLSLHPMGGEMGATAIHDFHRADEGQLVTVDPEWTEHADIQLRTDLITYLKISVWNLLNPSVAALTGKVRAKGIPGGIAKIAQLYATTPMQVWQPMARGRVPAPEGV
jgi:hypothetical protein